EHRFGASENRAKEFDGGVELVVDQRARRRGELRVRGLDLEFAQFRGDEAARRMSLEDADGRRQKVAVEQIVLVEGERVPAFSRGDGLKHVAHRAQARWVSLIPYPRIAQFPHVLLILVGRSIVEQ